MIFAMPRHGNNIEKIYSHIQTARSMEWDTGTGMRTKIIFQLRCGSGLNFQCLPVFANIRPHWQDHQENLQNQAARPVPAALVESRKIGSFYTLPRAEILHKKSPSNCLNLPTFICTNFFRALYSCEIYKQEEESLAALRFRKWPKKVEKKWQNPVLKQKWFLTRPQSNHMEWEDPNFHRSFLKQSESSWQMPDTIAQFSKHFCDEKTGIDVIQKTLGTSITLAEYSIYWTLEVSDFSAIIAAKYWQNDLPTTSFSHGKWKCINSSSAINPERFF